MNVTRWEPFREFDQMLREYSPFFARGLRRGAHGTDWTPLADITETDKEYVIKADLPEVKKEDVKISLDNGVITVTGERRREQEHKEENEIRVETFHGSFSRSFALPDDIDAAGIQAESKDGVLRVRIPKKEPTQRKPISIEIK
jgi:HSP20 family protein